MQSPLCVESLSLLVVYHINALVNQCFACQSKHPHYFEALLCNVCVLRNACVQPALMHAACVHTRQWVVAQAAKGCFCSVTTTITDADTAEPNLAPCALRLWHGWAHKQCAETALRVLYIA